MCYIYIHKRVEMQEGPVSNRGTVERMIVTPHFAVLHICGYG